MSHTIRLLLLFPLLLALSARTSHCQCSNTWLPGDGIPGASGPVTASTLWDPDGAGPIAPQLVYGGSFSLAGTAMCGCVACQDTATGAWSAPGTGVSGGIVYALAGAPNGDLIVGGNFTDAGGTPASCIARWNGTSWSALGSGTNGIVRALTFTAAGDLVAGGDFTTAGGAPASRIARWDGTSWSAYGTGAFTYSPALPQVNALLSLPNGDLIVGGSFLAMDGVTAMNLARWNGTAWSAVGNGTDGVVCALTLMPNGNLAVGGAFNNAGGAPSPLVAIWNGASWIPTNTGLGYPGAIAQALCVRPNGDLIAGGAGSFGIRQWNGTTWSLLGSMIVQTMTVLPNGNVLVGASTTGSFPPLNYVAIYTGSQWLPVASGTNGPILDFAKAPNGDLVACGWFSHIGSTLAQTVARWNGSTWTPIASPGFINGPGAVTMLPNGNIVLGGYMDNPYPFADGAGVKLWNGTTWTSILTSPSGSGDVNDIVVMPNGEVIAAGDFYSSWNHWIMRCNGPSSSGLGSGTGGPVYALLLLPDGTLVVGGSFAMAGGIPAFRIAAWNGSTWSSPFGLGLSNTVYALARLPNGDIVAGGAFTATGPTPANYIARWNGSTWSPLGSGLNAAVRSLVVLPNGELIAGGDFTSAGGVTAYHIARWNGSAWSACDSGVNGSVRALAFDKNADLAVGGWFGEAGTLVSYGFARLSTSCPATAVASGNGCPSSGGSNTLSATTPPWLGGTFVAKGTGLPTTALVATVTSTIPIAQGFVPLAGIFAQGVPGCDVLVSPDILGILVTTTGTAVSSFALPNAPSLVGATVYHQMIPIELDTQGNWVAITATNALQLTAGLF